MHKNPHIEALNYTFGNKPCSCSTPPKISNVSLHEFFNINVSHHIDQPPGRQLMAPDILTRVVVATVHFAQKIRRLAPKKITTSKESVKLQD